MKRKLGIFLAAVLTLTSVMPVMAAEPVTEEVVSEIIEADGTAMDEVSVQDESENAFTITVGTETKQYPADKFIEVMDAATKAADADTEIEVSLSADIDTNKAPVVIWGGKVDLNLGGNTLTAGGECVYDNRDCGIKDYKEWSSYAENCRSDSAIIVAPKADSDAGLKVIGNGGVIRVDDNKRNCVVGITVAQNGILDVGSGVTIVASEGIELVNSSVTASCRIDASNDLYGAYGILTRENCNVELTNAIINVESTSSYASYGIELWKDSNFTMKGGTITVNTKGTGVAVMKHSGSGRFIMAGEKSNSTAKDDIKIKVTADNKSEESSGVYVDEYTDADNPAYIKNTKIEVSSDNGDYVSGIRFVNGEGSSVLIENCDVTVKSAWKPEAGESSPYEVSGIMNFAYPEVTSFDSQIRNVVVKSEGNGRVEGVRGYNVDGVDISVSSGGLEADEWVYGILTQGEKDISVKNAKILARAENGCGVYGISNWNTEAKVTIGSNCEFDADSADSARAFAHLNSKNPDYMPYIASDGKWFDKDGKQLSFEEVAEAKYVRTTKSKKTDPTPANTKTALSKLKFTWNESNQGSAKSPYLTYDGTEKKLGFKLETSGGTALAEDTDYTVTYTHSKKDFTKPGVVTVKIKAAEGSELYKGTLTKKYSIKSAKLADIIDDPNKSDDDGNLLSVEVNEGSPVTYDPKGARPSVKLIYDGKVLEAGKDYKVVKYLRNKSAAEATATNPPMVQILGKGNFTGTVKIAFTIEPKYVDTELLDITVKDILSDWHPGKFKSKPVIKDGKKKLKEGRDYKVKYSLSSNMIEEIPEDGKVDEGKEVFVEISGIGNYQSSTVVSYFVRYAMLNKCSAKVKEGVHLPASADDITPEMLTVIKDKASKMELVPDTDYLITGAQYITGKTDYLKVTIVGGTNNLYGGEKTLKIKLIKK